MPKRLEQTAKGIGRVGSYLRFSRRFTHSANRHFDHGRLFLDWNASRYSKLAKIAHNLAKLAPQKRE